MANKQYEDMINGVIGQVNRVADQVIKIKTKYEPKSYDYSSVASTLSIVAADGGQQASITPPAGVATVPIGAYTKIIITPPGTPQETPGDDDQVTLNGSFLWINKANTDIMQWKEIKTHVADGDIMVIERIADSGGFKNFQLVKWEDKQITTGSGGHWETIDPLTYVFTEPVKIRMTTGTGSKHIGYVSIDGAGIAHFESPYSFHTGDNMNYDRIIWIEKTNKTSLQTIQKKPDGTFAEHILADVGTVSKLEIWKD